MVENSRDAYYRSVWGGADEPCVADDATTGMSLPADSDD